AVEGKGAVDIAPTQPEHDARDQDEDPASAQIRPGDRARRPGVKEGRGRGRRGAAPPRNSALSGSQKAIEVDFPGRRHAVGSMVTERWGVQPRFRPISSAHPCLPAVLFAKLRACDRVQMGRTAADGLVYGLTRSGPTL